MAEAVALEDKDNPNSRQKLFVGSCIDQFDDEARLRIDSYNDPKNVDASYSKNASKAVGNGTAAGVAAGVNVVVPGLGYIVGNATRKVFQKASNLAFKKAEQKNGSQKQRKINDLLVGYRKDDPEWKTMLFESFNTIFINYAVQITYVLSETSDDMPYSKLIFKMARDVIVRIFDFLEDTMEEILTKELLLEAFVRGNLKQVIWEIFYIG